MRIRMALASSVVIVTLVATYITSPFAQALNTHSINLESESNQYLSIPDGSQTGLDVTGNLTMELWVKLESSPATNGAFVLIGKNNYPSEGGGYAFNYLDVGGTKKLQMRLCDTSTTCYSDGAADYTLSIGTWYHLASTFDASNGEVRIYVNGSQVGSTVNSGLTQIVNNGGAFALGDDPSDPSFNTDGLMDDVRVWDVTRAGAEVAADKDHELIGNEAGLVGYWQFNGSSLEDSTANNNDLTNNNGAQFSSDVPFPVAPPPPPMHVRKSVNESAVSTAALQNDDQLLVGVQAGKAYEVEGVVFATSNSGTPDLRTAFTAPGGSDVMIGYIATGASGDDEVLQASGVSSARIAIPANQVIQVVVHGTVVAGADGNLQWQWAQFAANANAVTVKKGSYLRVTEI
jgi:hypothetical protein